MDLKKLIASVIIAMILLLGISIEREVSVFNMDNPYDKYINYNMTVYPDNLKLTQNQDIREKDLLVNLFQGLVKEDDEGMIVGGLAEDFQVSEDGLEYNFTLRQQIKYSTGENITSQDFVEFFREFLEDEENIYRDDLDCIYGVRDFIDGVGDFSQVAIIPKDNILTIRLNYPCPYFLKQLAHPVYVLRDYNINSNYKEIYRELRYTGPFSIKEIFYDSIILKKNYSYYNEENVTNEEIRISFINSLENALAIFEDVENIIANKIDIMTELPISEIDRLDREGRISTYSSNECYILEINKGYEHILGDEKLRVGISQLIDRNEYAANISKILLTPINSFLSTKEGGRDSFIYDKEDMIDYFDQIYEDEEIKIRIIYEEKSLERRIAKELSEDLSKDMEKEVIVRGYTAEELEKVLNSGDYDIYIRKFNGKYDYELEFFKEAVVLESQLYIDGLNKSKYILDEVERREQLSICEQILKEELKLIPIYKVNHVLCYKKGIEGLYLNQNGNIILEKIKRVL